MTIFCLQNVNKQSIDDERGEMILSLAGNRLFSIFFYIALPLRVVFGGKLVTVIIIIIKHEVIDRCYVDSLN